MQRAWSWSTACHPFIGKPHEQIQELCRSAGLAGIEGWTEFFPNETEAEIEAIGAAYRRAGVPVDSFHLPFGSGDDIASFYETLRRQAVDKARYWIERAAAAGARVGIQHPSTNRLNVDVEGVDNYLGQLGKSLETLLPIAERLGFTIALENMLPGDEGGRLGSRPGHFARFSQEFAHPSLGFCLDTGHALVAGGAEADAFFDAMAPRLVAFHLADNGGDRDSHLAPGRGLVDWDCVFRRAATIGYADRMCIETPPFAQGPDYTPEAWQQLVADTDALAERALAVWTP